MKKIFLPIVISILLLACKQDYSPPSLSIENLTDTVGNGFDTIAFKVIIESEIPPVQLKIEPSLFGDNYKWKIDTSFSDKYNFYYYNYKLTWLGYDSLINIDFIVIQSDGQVTEIQKKVFLTMEPIFLPHHSGIILTNQSFQVK